MSQLSRYMLFFLIVVLTPLLVTAEHIDCAGLSADLALESIPGEDFGTICISSSISYKEVLEDSSIEISSGAIDLASSSSDAYLSFENPWIAYERNPSESEGLKMSYSVQNIIIGDSKAKLGITNIEESVLKSLGYYDYNDWKNEESQWMRKTSASIKFVKGKCIVSIHGSSGPQQARRFDNTDNKRYNYLNEYHYVEEKEHEIYNKHPEFDGGKTVLLAKLKSTATEIEKNLDGKCGDEVPSIKTNDFQKKSKEEINIMQEPEYVDTALVDSQPTDQDLQPTANSEGITLIRLRGTADVKMPDGTWLVVKEGDVIPVGATILTAFGSEATLEFQNKAVLVLRHLSEMKINKFDESIIPRTNLDLHTGSLRFKVAEGDFETDIQVGGGLQAHTTGTDFAIEKRNESGKTIFEIYDSALEISILENGEKYVISTTYGSDIKRLEVYDNGIVHQKIVNVRKTHSKGGWMISIIVVIVLAIGGVLYFKKK